MDLPPLIRAMGDPGFYPHRPAAVEMLQTHISYVFLAGRLVYKVKKPVDFGFLNFTTVARRRHFCLRELELNRRLAPGLYRRVIPLRKEGAIYHPGRRGRVVDYAVVMRRIPDRALLSHHLEDGRVTREMMRELARFIERFHRRAAAAGRWGSPAVLRRNSEEDFSQTQGYRGRTLHGRDLDLIAGYARALLQRHRVLLRRRITQGRIRDGHGDLHADHVGWAGGRPFAFDCIEFTPRFRCADVAAEVAFLVMDLEERGAWPLAEAFLEEYLRVSRDEEIRPLLDYYLCYRAYVRGKVNSFLVDDPQEGRQDRMQAARRAARYFHLSAAYAKRDRRPVAVVMTGPAGAGKSTLAELLADRLGFTVFSSDLIRKRLAGVPPTFRTSGPVCQDLYSARMSRLTYRTLLEEAAGALRRGENVVLDATFLRQKDRRRARNTVVEAGGRFALVEVVVSESRLRSRLAARLRSPGTVSDAGWEVSLGQQSVFEQPRGFGPGEHLVSHASGSREMRYTELLKGLYPIGPVE